MPVLDETLFMQTRLFRMFLERYRLSPEDGNRVFNAGGIWSFIADCYDLLHLSGDEAALADVVSTLEAKGVAW